MWGAVKLPDVHDIALVLENGGLVVVHIKIIWSREDSHNGRESSGLGFAVHAVSAAVLINEKGNKRTL